MQARAEGAVRITKEHVRCLLKHAHMPYRFWPWALTQFCRVFNYWPSKGHAPPWELLPDSNFSHSLERDITTFGCLAVGVLPREHPDVSDTTHSDRGLEGAFLGWDLTTPTCWIYSFKKRKPVRLTDVRCFNRRFPFRDPSMLLNKEDIDEEEIARMHAQDEVTTGEDEMGEDDYENDFCTPSTQPMPTVTAAPSPRPVKAVTDPVMRHPQLHTDVSPPPQRTRAQRQRAGKEGAPRPTTTTLSDTLPLPPKTQKPTLPNVQTPEKLQEQDYDRNPHTWTTGAKVPLDASIATMADKHLNCQIVKPDVCRDEGQVLQFPISERRMYPCNVRRLLNLDCVNHELQNPPPPHHPLYALPGPFEDREQNEMWAQSVMAEADPNLLVHVDILEPDPKSHKQALLHPRLAAFWAEAAIKEMSGLEGRGCFRKHYLKDLSEEQRKRVFGSRFHHKIKRNSKTGQVKSCKIRLVVMGNRMEKGEDFLDAFAPVPRATAARILKICRRYSSAHPPAGMKSQE